MKFRPYIRRWIYQYLPAEDRGPGLMAWLTAMSAPLQDMHAIDFYSNNRTYYPGDRVAFKFKTFEAPDNTATSSGFSGKQPIIDNQINTDGSGNPYWKEVGPQTLDGVRAEARFRQSFTGQVIYLEHYLNASLNNNASDPYSNNSPIASGKYIYIEDTSERQYLWFFRANTWPVLDQDAFYWFRRWDSSVSYSADDIVVYEYQQGGERPYRANQTTNPGESPSSHPTKWDIEMQDGRYFERKSYYLVDPHFIIWVPVEVANTLTNWEDVIRKHADRYVISGRKYEVKSY